jgi:hypothetical protein
MNCLQNLKLINRKYIFSCALNQKIEDRNIRKQNVSKRKEKEREEVLLRAIKERGIQVEGKGEEYLWVE